MSRRRKRSSLALVSFLIGSALGQGGAMLLYDAVHEPPPRPPASLTVVLDGEGEGAVRIRSLGHAWGLPCVWRDLPEWFADGYCAQSLIADMTCEGDECRYKYPRGHMVVVEAEPAEDSYLDGWSSQCRPGDPFTQCTMVLYGAEEIAVYYEKVPDDVDVETIAMDNPEQEEIELPDPELEAMLLDEPVPEPQQLAMTPPPEPEPEPEELPVPKPPEPQELAPPRIPKQPEPQPQPQPAPRPKKKEQPPPRMKSVEVADDENVVKDAPKDAQFLSDKNRDVAEQTHARDTNLERAQKGDGAFTEKSEITSDEIGAKEDEIAQLEDTEASSLDTDDEPETSHTGEEKIAKGIKVGEGGGGGQLGDGGDGGDGSQKGALAMRGIEGRGAPGGPPLPETSDEPGSGGKKGRKGKRGRRGIKTDISFEDYERIVGKDKADEEVEIAKRTKSKKKGRWSKKIARVQSSLENFTPEIKPGNQTALKTRAEPFAVYVARMHRKIHELWGFGFLEELDGKPSTHEMNDWGLMTKIEVVMNPDGTVDKATIVKHSGVLTFDVAALDTVFTGEPYDPPPKDIRSPDGKVYLHWRFHRDWRQCGTFGVDKFIRNDVPSDADTGDDDAGLFTNPRRKRRRDRAKPEAGDHDHAGGGSSEASRGAAARAAANLPTPDDPNAEKTALAWIAGFESGQTAEMANVSGVPFLSRGQIVANDLNGVAAVYRTILKETAERKVVEWRVLSPAGYRKRFDTLPQGAEPGTHLFLVIKVKGDLFTLTLKPQSDGTYDIVGFDR